MIVEIRSTAFPAWRSAGSIETMSRSLRDVVAVLWVAGSLASAAASQGGCGAQPQVEALGGGSAGAMGVPQLVAATPREGRPFSVQFTGGLAGAGGCVAVSSRVAPLFLPPGVTFYPDLTEAIVQSFTLDESGRSGPLISVATLPAGACGLSLYFQGVVSDPGAVGGVAVSDGLRVGIGGGVGAAPEVSQPSSPTAATMATLAGTGSTEGNRLVVDGGAVTAETTLGAGGRFSLAVALKPNRLNRLYLREELAAGQFGASATVDVVQDGALPSLFVDFPANGGSLHTAATDVAGRVGDALSGFAGLSVTVNGRAAVVNPGIGTNGTFDAGGVPLAMGANAITVVATDAVGNQTTRMITVTREVPTGPTLTEVSGGGQQGRVGAELPQPLVVRITDPLGQPFAGKVVTFNVTRSDGRLAAQPSAAGGMMLQAVADAQGLARAWWRLGSDAGCGNNRVAVSSVSVSSGVYFCASAIAAPPSQINVGGGGNQVASTGGAPPEPLAAWVNDGCNGVAGVPVSFTIVEGSGSLTSPGVISAGTQVTVMSSATGHASALFTAGPNGGNQRIEATFPGNPGAPATFVVYAAKPVAAATRFAGIVLDNSQQPVARATCTLEFAGAQSLVVLSDASGQFAFEQLTASGLAGLTVDGATATSIGGVPMNPALVRLPELHFTPFVIAGVDNALPMPVLLPRLNPANDVVFDGTQDVELRVAGIDGLVMRLSRTTAVAHANGRPVSALEPITLSLNQVHADDIPMPMPNGAAPPFAWTLQPGGTRFSPPVSVEMPNMPGLPPGAASYILSFDHDTEQFEIVASATVTADGSCIVSDPGSGISTAGWGGSCPPYPNTGGAEHCSYAEVEILYKLFIAPSAIRSAPIPFVPLVAEHAFYAGDDRGFDYESSDARTLQRLYVTVDPAVPSGIVNKPAESVINVTRGYDDEPPGSDVTPCQHCYPTSILRPLLGRWCLTKGATPECSQRAMVGVGITKKLSMSVERIGSDHIRARIEIIVGNPCEPFADPADVDLFIDIRQSCNQGRVSPVTYRLTGVHDGFPWHELYLNGVAVYLHDPCVTEDDLTALLGDPEYAFPGRWQRLEEK